MKINVLYIILMSIVFSDCSAIVKKPIIVEQVGSELPVIIRVDSSSNYVKLISFPLVFNYENTLQDREQMNEISYKYLGKSMNRENYWSSKIEIYELIDDSLKEVKFRYKVKDLSNSKKRTIVIYTMHFLEKKSDEIQEQLKINKYDLQNQLSRDGVYVLKMESLEKFSKKYPSVVKALLNGDSISFGVSNLPNTGYKVEDNFYVTLPTKY